MKKKLHKVKLLWELEVAKELDAPRTIFDFQEVTKSMLAFSLERATYEEVYAYTIWMSQRILKDVK